MILKELNLILEHVLPMNTMNYFKIMISQNKSLCFTLTFRSAKINGAPFFLFEKQMY